MKILGVCLIVLSMVIGYISDSCIDPMSIEPFVGLAFCFFIVGIYALIKTKNTPPTPLKRGVMNLKECICNDIGKHTPGGRCEAEHN